MCADIFDTLFDKFSKIHPDEASFISYMLNDIENGHDLQLHELLEKINSCETAIASGVYDHWCEEDLSRANSDYAELILDKNTILKNKVLKLFNYVDSINMQEELRVCISAKVVNLL